MQSQLQKPIVRDLQPSSAFFGTVQQNDQRARREVRPSKALSAISEVSNSTTAMPNARASSFLGEFLSLPPLRDSDASCSSDSGSFVFPDVPSLHSTFSAGDYIEGTHNASLYDHPAFQQSTSITIARDAIRPLDERKRLNTGEVRAMTQPHNVESYRKMPLPEVKVYDEMSGPVDAPISDTNISFSLSDLVNFYDEESDSDTPQLRFSANAQSLAEAFVRSISSLANNPVDVNQQDLSVLIQQPADETSKVPEKEQNTSMSLRFGALMTSKWLSFGRVLFSPAHAEVSQKFDSRVLVIDGLGKGKPSSPLVELMTQH